MSGIKAVFFDLDGTLWDSVGCASHVMEIVLPKLAPHLPKETPASTVAQFNAAFIVLVRQYGLIGSRAFSRLERFEKLLDLCKLGDSGLVQRLTHTYDAARRMAMRTFLRPDAIRVLKELKYRNLTRGVITNGVPAIQRHAIQTLGLQRHLDHTIIGDIEGYSKPDCRLFRRALDLAHVEPGEMLYVGDSPLTDVLGASRVGIRTALLKTWLADRPARFPAPDHTIDNLQQVLDIVRDI